jgi:hypothetical protein
MGEKMSHKEKQQNRPTGHGPASLATLCLAGASVSARAMAAPPDGTPGALWVAALMLAMGGVLLAWWLRQARLAAASRAQCAHGARAVGSMDWPHVAVLVSAHDDEAVVAACLQHLMLVDYPAERLMVMPMRHRATDRGHPVVAALAKLHPGRIRHLYRTGHRPGKAAALKEAMAFVDTEFIVVLDADSVASRGLVKRLIAPFIDPEVGAVLGHASPRTAGAAMPPRRPGAAPTAHWQKRIDLALAPQGGGKVGAVRVSALRSVGGWRDDALAEDTDLGHRLLLGGWRVAGVPGGACHQWAQPGWGDRVRQARQWAEGQTQAMARHGGALLSQNGVPLGERAGRLVFLGAHLLPPLLLLATLLGALLHIASGVQAGGSAWLLLAFVSLGAWGHLAALSAAGTARQAQDGGQPGCGLLAIGWMAFGVGTVAAAGVACRRLFAGWRPGQRPRRHRDGGQLLARAAS